MDCMLLRKEFEEEFAIHITTSTASYPRLRFSLLCSTWLPRCVGVILWSVLHLLLVICVAALLLALVSTLFLIVLPLEALIWLSVLCLVPIILIQILLWSLVSNLVWMCRLIISGRGCSGWSSRGGTQTRRTTQPPQFPHYPVAVAGRRSWLDECIQASFSVQILKAWYEDWVPHCIGMLGNWCREVVPMYDTIVIGRS